MLGQLFQSWTPSRRGHALSRGSSHGSQHALDSTTEDAHTLALLFPSPGGLHHPTSSARDLPVPFHDAAPAPAPVSAFDELAPDAGLPQDADVRVLAAQDESGALPKAILFDSRPPPAPPTPVAAERPPSSFNFFPRADVPSLQQSPTLPLHPRRGSHSQAGPPLASRGHSRGASNSSVGSLPSLRRLAKDADDELQSCLECMFGSAALRYTGKSTKVHILSKDPSANPWDRPATNSSSAYTLQAVARPTTSSRPSLARLPLRLSSFSDDKTARKILITRVFSVQQQSDFDALVSPTEQRSSDLGRSASTNQPRLAPRQRRSPVCAVALLIRIPSLPRHRRQPKSPTHSELLNSWSSSLLSDSARSSRGSDSMLESTIFDTNFGSLSSLADALEDEEGMVAITKHWTVIGKVLDQLQRTVERQVSAVHEGAGYRLQRSGSLPMTLGSPQEPTFASGSSSLRPFVFAGDDILETAAEKAAQRLCQSFNTRHAVPGQDRWAVWKEEARWVDRWARASDQSPVLDSLLSAFLATHLDWLDQFDLAGYRHRRGIKQRRKKAPADDPMAARTVIVSNNKMKARRFVFLLAAFLPKSVELLSMSDSTPYGSERGDGFSSPPKMLTRASRSDLKADMAIDSARRGSRELQRRYSTRQLSNLSAAIEVSRSVQGRGRSRGAPSSVSGSPNRDPSRFTTSTTDISDTTPVAHITTPVLTAGASEPAFKNRRGSSASSRLWDTLRCVPPSEALTSPPTSPEAPRIRKASFDANQRDSTTADESTVTGPAASKLDRMVGELTSLGITRTDAPLEPTKSSSLSLPPEQSSEQHGTAPRDIPTPRQKPSDPPMMPFSLSINEKDGFVDIDIPLDSYGASLQSLSSRDQSDKGTTTMAGSNPLHLPPKRSSHDVSVGGYLSAFCQDLTLQAVRPYPGLEDDLRAALLADALSPTVSSSDNPAAPSPLDAEPSTILVANIDTGDLRKLTLRRRSPSSFSSDRHPDEQIALARIPASSADDALAAALARTLAPTVAPAPAPADTPTSTSHQPSRASSLRTRSSATAAALAGAGAGAGPDSPLASSAGTASVAGTPPAHAHAANGPLDRTRRALFDPLREIVRRAAAAVADGGGADGEDEPGESMLYRAVRERIAAAAE